MESFPLDPKDAIVIGLAVIAAIVAAKWFFARRRLPPEKTFRCGRCSAVEAHSARTIEAWRAGKTKLFCGSCHAKWLQSQPRGPRTLRTSRSSGSGCVVVLLLALVVPALVLGAFYYAHRIA
jgi:predicted CxxxxCH...CXXCH cytochrome family protein